MVRLVYQPRRRWALWLMGILSVAMLLALWAEGRETGRQVWLQLWWPIWFAHLARWSQGSLYVLTDRALLILGPWHGQGKAIPLAIAEVRPSGKRWIIRWRDGRLPCREELKLPAGVGAALEQTAAAARDLPLSRPPVASAYSAGLGVRWVWVMILGSLALVGLAIWLHQPLLVAPLVVILLVGVSRATRFVLAGQELLRLTGGRTVARIPLAAVTAIQEGKQVTTLVTCDPGHPEVRVSTLYATELLQAIRAHLGLDATPAVDLPEAASAVTEAAPAVPMDRCSLCGQPMGGGVSGNVLICQRCSDRARYEAVQGGYGLPGKETKPL